MLRHRLLHSRVRGFQITGGGQHHGPAASADGQHPGAVESLAVAFERDDQRLGVVESAQRDEGLDGVGNE